MKARESVGGKPPVDLSKCETAIEKPNCEALAQIFGLNPPLFF